MLVYKIIQDFLKKNNFLQDEQMLGVLFYGSYKYGLNNQNSDIDLLIIYDDLDNPNRLIRGNAFVNDIQIEYFIKTLKEIYIQVENDFITQSNASLSIIGEADIIYEKNHAMHDLQEYVINKFKNKLPTITQNRAIEKLATINNRMERLKKYAEPKEFGYYFDHLYNLIIEMLRRFYHELNGMPRIETSKGFKLYRDKQYQDMFSIDNIPDSKFLDMYFELIQNQQNSKKERLERLIEFFNYAKRTVGFDEYNYRVPIKSRYYENIQINTDVNLDMEIEQIQIPEQTLNAVKKFIEEMNYMEHEHFLGIIVYGSSLTGFNTKDSDIDLHVIFDNYDPNRLFRGKCLIEIGGDVVEIEYFEKSIYEEYLMAEHQFLHQDNAALSILGKGAIVYQRENGKVEELQKYVLHKFKDALPPLSIDEAREQISIMDNKIKKLENLRNEDSPYFYHFYHIVLEKMREVHHKIIGISQIATDKVPKIYTDDAYRESVCKTNPSQGFVEEYLRLVTHGNDKGKMLEDIKAFYVKVKQGIELDQEYRIPIESSLKHLQLYLKNSGLLNSSLSSIQDMLAILNKNNG